MAAGQSAKNRLSALIFQAERGELDPKELAAAALRIGREALTHQRQFSDRNGNERSYQQPEYQHALRSLEVAAHLAGLTPATKGDESKAPGMTPSELKRAGMRLVVS